MINDFQDQQILNTLLQHKRMLERWANKKDINRVDEHIDKHLKDMYIKKLNWIVNEN